MYDIVVYEVENTLIAHSIVGIEEPNDKHSERYFLLQGDAVANPDRFPVKYEQMKGIYYDQRIPFVGSLIMFLQSPAGYICILLIVFGVFVTPVVEKRIWAIKLERLSLIGYTAEQLTKPAVCKPAKESSTAVPIKIDGKKLAIIRVKGGGVDVSLNIVSKDNKDKGSNKKTQ